MARFLFERDEANVEHIAGHQFTPEEAEEVFEGRHKVRRTRGGYYVALGATAAGRPAYVVFQRRPGRVIRVVTARDMKDSERRLYRRK